MSQQKNTTQTHAHAIATGVEADRVAANARGDERWDRWGPYLSERQWGTVREDYSEHGEAWDYFPHEMARSRAYRWGEDGLAGFSDDRQHLCLSVALWNGRDPILKERLFGLTNAEGNHGEDVKELYYYLDATPSHSYLRMLYKYPQHEFPYAALVEHNAGLGSDAPEYELLDTGVFGEDRYFDVVVEYAKAWTDDVCMRITVTNRGPDQASVRVLPQLVCRNTWSYRNGPRPRIELAGEGRMAIAHARFDAMELCFDGGRAIFGENDTNPSVWGDPQQGVFKDAFHNYVVHDRADAIHETHGTKAAIDHALVIPAGGSAVVRVRLRPAARNDAFADFDEVFAARMHEADKFYGSLQKNVHGADQRMVHRQALAGLIWSKQFFHFDVAKWLKGDPAEPPPPAARRSGRNAEWQHLNNADIISMPDKWEYPWYAAWDLAFHCIPLALVDAHFAKQQLSLLTREWYMHPNGQLPAYEWAFSDVNPPVHAWAAWRVFEIDRAQTGKPDLAFLESVFHKLMLNFTWWVNRKDREGNNVFEGGFLGLDNIGVFDRSAPLPTGGYIAQADGTSWMAMYSLNLMKIALELACHNPVYESIATKFFEHFLYIAEAISRLGEGGLWDEQDQFYYDVLNVSTEHGRTRMPMRLRSLVGLMPLFAVEVLEPDLLDKLPGFRRRLEWMLKNKPELAAQVSRWQEPGRGERRLLSLLRGHRLKKLLARMLDPAEFLSDYGIRSISKVHEAEPYRLDWYGTHYEVQYTPAESTSGLFGGNSNWRGPIWMPVNFLIVESLRTFQTYYGDDFKIELPTGSGELGTLDDAAKIVTTRLCNIFLKDSDGKRPVYAASPRMQNDPHFRDHILFYEYFHGDSGRGVGASHQTGWTALVAALMQPELAIGK